MSLFKRIYVKRISGPLLRYRQLAGYSLLGLLLIGPFIRLQGEPLFLFNLVERKFAIFGAVFYPQDLHLFVFGMLILMVFIVLFTVIFGRIWCGWACPQTIFMELIFRRIEYWIEGDATQQRKLQQARWTVDKIRKRLLKHSVFFLISFGLAHVFLAYFIGSETVLQWLGEPRTQHLPALSAILIFSLVFYVVFAYVREIVCTTICPYGRLQGVLLDEQSLSVAYDTRRASDCVDCGLCERVCPTGIDIRNGLQPECINCTACIDACDSVMLKRKRPEKLIGFYSLKTLSGRSSIAKPVRAIAYSAVLALLLGIFGFLLLSRSVLDATILRTKGTSYIFREDGSVANLYDLDLTNKSVEALDFRLETSEEPFSIQLVSTRKTLGKGESAHLSFLLVAPREDIQHYKTTVRIALLSGDVLIKSLETTFVAPPGGSQKAHNIKKQHL